MANVGLAPIKEPSLIRGKEDVERRGRELVEGNQGLDRRGFPNAERDRLKFVKTERQKLVGAQVATFHAGTCVFDESAAWKH